MMVLNHGLQLDDQNIFNMSNYFYDLKLQKPGVVLKEVEVHRYKDCASFSWETQSHFLSCSINIKSFSSLLYHGKCTVCWLSVFN